MFKCVTYIVLIVVCMFSAFSAPVYSQAQPDWTMEAFEKQRVTIVATTHFNDLVAGTDSGLYMHRGSQWLKLGNTYAPVRDIVMLDSFKMALAMGGKGQDLAGIYIGNFLWGHGNIFIYINRYPFFSGICCGKRA